MDLVKSDKICRDLRLNCRKVCRDFEQRTFPCFSLSLTEPRSLSTKKLVDSIVFPDHGAFQIPGLCRADTRRYYTSDGIRRMDTKNTSADSARH